MNSNTPLLSISILSSARKESIRKTLDSLNSLRKKVPSELILVDTAQDEETLAILREYSDIIIPFKWCNDFAKARNVGLDAAKGKWFMFIDDDEWFIDTKEIEDFFLKGEYKKYAKANYLIRNYTTLDGRKYHDTYNTRLCRIGENTKFVGKIHEQLILEDGNLKVLGSMAEHYGYAFATREDELEHSKRNSTLLKAAIEENPEDVRAWGHLLNEYCSLSEFNELTKGCEKALSIFVDKSSWEIDVYTAVFHCGRVLGYLNSGEYDKAIECVDEGLNDKRVNDVAKTMLYYMRIEVYMYAGRYQEYIDNADIYFNYYDKYAKYPEKFVGKVILYVEAALQETFYIKAHLRYCFAALRLKRIDLFKKSFPQIGFEKSNNEIFSTVPTTLQLFLELILDYEDEEALYKTVLSSMMKNKEALRDIEKIIDSFEFNNQKLYGLIYKYSKDTKINSKAINYMRFVCAEDSNELKLLINGFSKEAWEEIVDRYCFTHPIDEVKHKEELVNSIASLILKKNACYFAMKAACYYVKKSEKDYTVLHDSLSYFATKAIEYHKCITAVNPDSDSMPSLCVAGYLIKELFEYESSDLKMFTDCYKKIVSICPGISEEISAYASLVVENYKEEQTVQLSDEMKMLKAQIIDKVVSLEENGMTDEALAILNQLKAMIPNDPDIENLIEKLSI